MVRAGLVGLMILGLSLGCDDGGSDGDASAGVGGMGGVGGQGGGVGGQGGGVGGQGGGVGGQGGGVGGQGGMGGQGGGMGGAGGGCTPDCSQSECGPDGCGGTCGPGCRGGELCTNGRCQPGECDQGTFECGGECVDLVEDVRHCGSCGNACADDWPPAVDDAGISMRAAGMTPVCAQADCQFDCPGAPGVDPAALLNSLEHCGGCNQACSNDLRGDPPSSCASGECKCLINGGIIGIGGGIHGTPCGDFCMFPGDNCDGGCCPQLDGPAAGQLAVDDFHAYLFTVDAIGETIIEVDADNCDAVQFTWLKYGDAGPQRVDFQRGGDCVHRLITSPGTQYAVHVLGRAPVQYDITLRHTVFPTFDVPGELQVQAAENRIYALIDVARDDHFNFFIDEAGRCAGDFIFDIERLDGNNVYGNRLLCAVIAVGQPQRIGLEAGRYLLRARAQTLEGQFRFRAE